MSEKKDTKNLIDELTGQLEPVKVMPHPLRIVLPWLGFAILYISLAVAALSIREDIFLKLKDPMYCFEMAMMLMISMSAAFSAMWLRVPDMRGQKWMLAVPLTAFSLFIIWTSLRAGLEDAQMPDLGIMCMCILEATIFGAIPAMAIWFLSTRGRTTHPYLISLMNVLSIGGLGYVALRITCRDDDIAHIALYHIAPYMVFGIILALAGRTIYRW